MKTSDQKKQTKTPSKNETDLIPEATPKSTREKLYRTTRRTLKSRKKTHLRKAHMAGRITPKKSGNNDPHRGGNRLVNEPSLDIQESIYFLRDNLQFSGGQLKSAVQDFKFRNSLNRLTGHMVATRLGGWKEQGGKYINDSGREASKKNWILTEEGRLKTRRGVLPTYDVDWLLEVQRYCEQ